MPATPPALEPIELKGLSGIQRAVALMLTLGEEHAAGVCSPLAVDEVKELSAAMARLGRGPARGMEYLLLLFASEVSTISSLNGSFETTERLLNAVMPPAQVGEVMHDIRGPADRARWDKLSNVTEAILASYLKHEYPRTVAVVLSRLRPVHAACVIAALPQTFALDVILRMLSMEDVGKPVIDEIAQTLKSEFMSSLSRTRRRRDAHELMAEMFNALDRSTEEALLGVLDTYAPDSAERIRSQMFTLPARPTPSVPE